MKIKQTNIMNLINSINERIKETGNEIVYYQIKEVLSILKLTETQVEYNGGAEALADELSGQKQFTWHKIGCLSCCLDPIREFCFVAYGRKFNDKEYETTGSILDIEPLDYSCTFDFDDDDFWIDLGFDADDLI